ncbi:uncharacterized protein TrAFT101_005634 [Trichoderma asperellum]|uniref:Secreted protein n=1 Tax=Trichoderma asperellum (strain ATCC 204424 / CBS 433.97 / NBRC 101777) TaxID=1042311 RepID=A0A2T3YY35_TRIA4|nr:hypothetical protein M441DRAFT_252665 [Trichoderma asperellum CBS 433.97]PTB37483.1 hypothetical protein M441DRAFT_252665 [Trichoderma asperellum CBS 433.97]UKZ90629.1 hypothetical protein TrAFT101_005634 [Trichoderma asperellum]
MIFFILPSLFTALELQSGSNRPQANAASGNAVITFFFTLFFFHAKHKCKVLSSARRYGNNGNGTKHWAEMFDFFSLLFLSITQNKMILSLDEFLFFFLFYSNSFLDFYELHTGGYTHLPKGKPRFGELLKEKTLEENKIHSFF